MTAATSRLRRRGIGAGVAALVGLTGLGTVVPAQALPNFEVARPTSTDNRFDTAASISRDYFTTVSDAIVVNGDNPVDALAASFLAGKTIPILYVKRDSVPAETTAALADLQPGKVWVVGGENAVSASTYAAVGGDERIDGDDRYETAVEVAQAKLAGARPSTVFLVTGTDLADALAIAPVAAKNGNPVLLTRPGTLDPATQAALAAWGTSTSVVIVGGVNAVSQSVEDGIRSAGHTVTRIEGDNRRETSIDIANSSAAGFSKTGVWLVNGNRPVDALPAAVVAAAQNYPIIFTANGSLGDEAEGYLTANAGTLTTAIAAGGESVIPASVVDAAEDAGQTVTSNATLNVAPATAATVAAVAGITTGTTGDEANDNRSYTVTGLTDSTQYRVTLVNSANLTTAANGITSFAIDRSPATVTSTNPDGANGQQASGNYLALPGTVTANIISVNGAAAVTNTGPGTSTSSATTSAVANPVNGAITFTVDADTPETYVPVVYLNGGTGLANNAGGVSPRLELNASGVPVEAFGLGGATTVTALPAAAGAGSNLPITSVNKAANSFNATVTGVARQFSYDSNDTYQIGGTPSTYAAFSAALSAGDSVTVNYGTDAAASSSFNLTDSNPALISASAVAGLGNSTNDVTVTATFTANSVDTIRVERAPVVSGTIGTYSALTTITPTAAQLAAGSATYADNDLAAGTYSYRLTPVNDGDAGDATVASNVSATTPAADTTAPLALSTRVVTNAGFATDVDNGDVIRLILNEDVTVASGAALRFTDSTGDFYQLTNGSNATFSLNSAPVTLTGSDAGTYPASRVLTITVTGTPTPIQGTATTALPATYNLSGVATAGISDTAGNAYAGQSVSAAVNEVQSLAVSGTPTGGTFTLTYSGQTTSAIAYNASAADVQTALVALSNIDAGDVTATGGALPGTAVTLTFGGALAATNVTAITANGGGLTGGSTPTASVTTTTQGATQGAGAAGGTVINR